jgi:5'-methylthioadenosine phosphorylase
MERLAVVGGSTLLGTSFAANGTRRDVDVDGRAITLVDMGDCVVLQRHGLDGHTAAPAIDHAAHLRALELAGCDRIMALSSVGALHRELAVGMFLAPDDFIALHLGISLSDELYRGAQVPGFDERWRARMLDAWREHGDVAVVDGGVYWQAIGPRFETRAEIRLIAAHADVIGMTVASECILAGELGIPYAAVCVIDNFANGVADKTLTVAEFQAGVAANRERLLVALDAVLPALVGAGA